MSGEESWSISSRVKGSYLRSLLIYVYLFYIHVCVYVHLGMSLCLCMTPQRSEEDIGSLGTVVDDCELLSGFWEQNLGPLQEQ